MFLKIPFLIASQEEFKDSKSKILREWIAFDSPREILIRHKIEPDTFINDYAGGVFDYFMGVIAGETEIGNCPIMQSLLAYLKDREVSADELFEICSHFRRAMVDFSYDANLNSKALFGEISYVFDKNFRGILKYYTDTIFQKEQEINRSVKLLSEYKKALDASALISKTDMNGNITYVNDKLLSLCESSESEILGRKYTFMNHEDVTKEEQEAIWKELKENNIYQGTIKNKKKNGLYYYMDATIVKINDPHDNETEYMSVAYDVTKLIDARAEALKASQAKEYFLSNMSHEIRTPLNAILGFVNLLIAEDISKKHREYLDIILSSGENLLSIINDILDFSKLRSGEFTIESKIFSLHEEISHTMELFVASANNKDITIVSFIDPNIPKELFADALRIKQILSNFLSNAIKFTPSGGVISVSASCENKMLKISVEDSGIGIDEKDIHNIFTAFAQAQYSELSNYDGTGLGLSICHQLTEHMGGHVGVRSELGEGSIFWMEIPVDVHTAQCQTFDNIQNFQKLKMVVYVDGEMLYQHESFLKYANIFNMDITVVKSLECDFDVAIFVHEEIKQRFKNEIINSDKKFIALMSKRYDEYDKYSHIGTMSFPIYCSKIHTVFEELLYPEISATYSQKSAQKFQGHILVAEDNEANQELIKILLKKYGLTYDLVENGYKAVEFYKENSYDLILMDEQMPVMDGNVAIRKILEYELKNHLQHTPVSALTANVIKGAKERGLLSGFDSFLGKPIVLKELERVFLTYLKVSSADSKLEGSNALELVGIIKGLDTDKLAKELMLNSDELLMLLTLFIKKMATSLDDLQNAIKHRDYKKIALCAHAIKGSSGNFRIESLQDASCEMEKMAKNENSKYNYEKVYMEIKNRVDQIEIL